MGINAYDQFYNPIQPKPLDFNFLLQAKAYKDKQAEQAATLYESALKPLREVKALPVEKDINTRNEKVKYYEDKLKSWYDNYGTGSNTRTGLRDLADIKSEFQSDFQYGVLGNIHNKALQYEKLLGDFQKADAEGKFTGMSDAAKYVILQKPLQDYKGWEEQAPGMYNSVQWGDITQYPDFAKDLSDMAQQWAASGVADKTLTPTNEGYLVTGTTTVIPYDEVYLQGINMLKSNPKYSRVFKDLSSYYQSQSDRATSYAPDGTPYWPSVDERGNPLYQRAMSGSELLDERLRGIAGFVAEREAFKKQDNEFHKRWLLEEALRSKKDKPEPPEVSYPGVSQPNAYSNYWQNKKDYAINGSKPITSGTIPALGYGYGATGSGIMMDLALDIMRLFSSAPDDSESVKSDLAKAEKIFGRYTTDPDTQKKLLEKYYDHMSKTMNYPYYKLPGNQDGSIDYEKANKKAEEINNFYFYGKADENGLIKSNYIGGNMKFKMVGADGTTVLTGQDIKSKFPDVNIKWVGSLIEDNPYWATGEAFMLYDKDGQSLGLIASEGANASQYDVLHKMYQAKYLGEDIKLPLDDDLIVSYERGYAPNLDNNGLPILDPSQDKAVIKNKFGKVIVSSHDDRGNLKNPELYGTSPVKNAYLQLANLKNDE